MRPFLFLLLMALPILTSAQRVSGLPAYPTEWHKVDSLMAEGLPQAARALVNQLYGRAKAARNYPQLAKAAMYRLSYRVILAEDEFMAQIHTLKKDVADTPEPGRSVLQSVLAETYWRYYQQNRFKFHQRTTVSRPASGTALSDDDLRTWDTRHLITAVSAAYKASLQNADVLQKTPLSACDVIVERGDAETRILRPTLYDLLAHRAINYFQSTEPDVIKPTFRFELNQPDYLAGPDQFVIFPLATRDSLSGQFQALRIYQQLIVQHLTDANPLALADVDNERLRFVHQYSTAPDKDSLYRQTLEQQIARYKGKSPAEADYVYQLCRVLTEQGAHYRLLISSAHKADYKRAFNLARDLISRYPATLAARNASLLLAQLTQQQLSPEVEEVTEPDKPFRVHLTYRNVPTLFYRIYKMPLTTHRPGSGLIAYYEPMEQMAGLRTLLAHPLVAQGKIALPDDGDLQAHSVELPMSGLPLGQYAIIMAADESFTDKARHLTVTPVTVSQLGYLHRLDNDTGVETFYVTDRQTGQPLADVEIAFAVETNTGLTWITKTNTDGRVDIPLAHLPTNESYWFVLKKGADVLATDVVYTYRARNQPETKDQTTALFFTDRAIYRPGQTIYFKGLHYSGKANNFSVVAGQETDVFLLDVNSDQIGKLTLTTNEFGTFTGTFTVPTGRLTGVMTIGSIEGRTTIWVEEYKRPTFAVMVESLKKSAKLDQTVNLSAVARTLAGAVVDGAQVRYRVSRSYEQPYWSHWRRQPYRSSPMTEIASGEAITDDRGNVRISFPATADHSLPVSDNPRFTFTITLDVTDRAGETRSATELLRIGYVPLQVDLSIPQQVSRADTKPYRIRVTNQSGQSVPVKMVSVTISYRQAPDRPLRKRLWPQPDRQLLSRDAFSRLFPNDLYDNEDDPATWPATVVRTITGQSISVADLQPGTYSAEATVTDSTGEMARQQEFFSVEDSLAPSGQVLLDGRILVQKATAEPGESASFLVGTGQGRTTQPMWVLLSVEENHQLVRQEWLRVLGKPQLVVLPITEKQRGGFGVSFALVQQGRFYSEAQFITVPFTNKELTVETQTFRDKLKPGQPEEWTLKLTGPAKDQAPAELTATLYDASLDQFVRHHWNTAIYSPYAFGGWGTTWQSGCFGLSYAQRFFYRYAPSRSFQQRHYDQLASLVTSSGSLRIIVTRTGNTIRGRVTDAAGLGVPGVTVTLKSRLRVTTTNEQGHFAFMADAGAKRVRLQFGFIGYLTQEVDMGLNRRFLTMPENVQALDEVVVVGYGTEARRDVTGAVATLSGSKAAVAFSPQQEGEPNAEEIIFAPDEQATPKKSTSPAIHGNQLPLPVIRKNFNETAFFFPQLHTDGQGTVVLKFTMPEALTRWHLMTFAHTKDMKTGSLSRDVVTQKELMITANAPRFLREGDTLTLVARINNLTDRALTGTATLTLLDALTGKPVEGFGPTSPLSISMAPGVSTAVSWILPVPNRGPEAVTLRLTAQAGNFSDGEERTIPVLPNRMLVTDTQPFWVNGNGTTATFNLLPLTTLSPELPVQHERLTVEVTSNPAWYALQSLPYLMEYRYECAEQLFSRMYATSLAAHILNSRPAFRRVVDAWQRGPVPESPLQTNEELKAVTLENTPWLADARSETARIARLGQLFDQNQLAGEQQRAFDKLTQLQTESGGFTWFSGMKPDLTMTLHMLSGFGHLQKLGIQWSAGSQVGDVQAMTNKAVQYADAQLNNWMADKKTRMLAAYLPVQYLYARSFYPDKPIDRPLLTYLTTFISANWRQSSLQSQAMAALALSRFGDKIIPTAILKSLRERAKTSEELGMYWPENQAGLSWYQAPVETQAALIEAFDEIANDQATVNNARRWLLRQKQTQSWPSTKATTEAVYALLLRGSDWLNATPNTLVTAGGQSIESRVTKTAVATGYQKVVYAASEIKPELGVVQISKPVGGPAWGAAYWQHFEPLDQVKPSIQATEAGLSVQKTLFVQTNSPEGPVITPITAITRLKTGDLIKVRVVLKTDRAMEYVHLKDGRASGFEPEAALSGYKYQNGLGYYEAPRDASTDFFIGYLPAGTHVFEYALRVAQTGDFSAGIATVQCFYAPEFAAHSTGERIRTN